MCNNRNNYPKRSLIAFIVSVYLCLGLSGCGKTIDSTQLSQEEQQVQNIVNNLPNAQAIPLYGKVSVAERKISLILEGTADTATMMKLADLLGERKIICVIFLPGNSSAVQPELVRYLSDAGISIGNYGLTGEKNMAKNKSEKNARQLYMAQHYLSEASGQAPTLLRCNVSEYTEAILKIAGLCNIKAAVAPTVFLSHRSFLDEHQALNFARKTPRGSIISVKIGQELDISEFQAADKQIEVQSDPMQTNISAPNQNDQKPATNFGFDIVATIRWLLDAYAKEEYDIISIDKLQAAGTEMDDKPRELDPADLEALNINLYPHLVTDKPFGVQENSPVSDFYFNKAVFVGDSVSTKLEDYVKKMRKLNPDYMGTAQFLAGGGLSVGNALWQVSDESRHPVYQGECRPIEDSIGMMDVDMVYIMLGMNDIAIYNLELYLENYRTLIHLIKKQSPGVTICIQSITPGTSNRVSEPANRMIFAYDLKLVEFCKKYGYEYIDVAYAIRDKEGWLPVEHCIDPDGMGLHFDDETCAVWIDYLRTHAPVK